MPTSGCLCIVTDDLRVDGGLGEWRVGSMSEVVPLIYLMREEGHAMTQYLITFPSDAMNHIPDDEMSEVGRAAHAVCQELIDAGVYLLTGGLEEEPANLVGTDGTVTDGPRPDFIGGITIVDVPSREDALRWAAKIAAACRCTQEVRAIGFDPELEAMLGKVAVDVDPLKTRDRG